MDSIDIKLELEQDTDYDYDNQGKLLSFTLREHSDGLTHSSIVAICVLNGEEIKKTFSIGSFLYSGISGPHEIFTCSCGIAGCVGIWNGINVKHRRYTVEWRMPKHSDYTFLNKKFYSFDRIKYEAARNSLIEKLTTYASDSTIHDQFGQECDSYNALSNNIKYYLNLYNGK